MAGKSEETFSGPPPVDKKGQARGVTVDPYTAEPIDEEPQVMTPEPDDNPKSKDQVEPLEVPEGTK